MSEWRRRAPCNALIFNKVQIYKDEKFIHIIDGYELYTDQDFSCMLYYEQTPKTGGN